MKQAFITLFGGLLLTSCGGDSGKPQATPPAVSADPAPQSPMEYVTLCKAENDCKKFSRLVMGTDHLVQGDWTQPGQKEITEQEAFAVLDEAAKNGINFFDTSPIYVGGVENKLGKWKQTRRDKITGNDFYYASQLNPDRKLYLLSKGGFPFDLSWAKKLEKGPHSPALVDELKQRGILKEGDAREGDGSLKLVDVPAGTYASRLFGDRALITQRVSEELGHTISNLNGDITVYLMHRDDGDAIHFKAVPREQTPVKTILEALSAPEISSKHWLLGWSNWQTPRINESLKLTAESEALPRPVINSPYFSLFEMSEVTIHALGVQVTHKEMMDPNFQKGIKIMPYSPLGGFSILDKPDPKWETAKRAAKENFDKGDAYWQNVYPAIFTEANEKRWNRVVAFTRSFNEQHRTNYAVDQMVNAYALAHPRTDLLAIGAITIEQVRRTVGALQLSKQLRPSDLDFLYGSD